MKTRIESSFYTNLFFHFLKTFLFVFGIFCFAVNQSFAQDNALTSFAEMPITTSNSNQASSLIDNCFIPTEITMENLTLGGPVDSVGCQNGDELLICFKIYAYHANSNGINRCLHSLIPDFGNCLNIFPTPQGEPGIIINPMTNSSNLGDWGWFENGIVYYNDLQNGYYPPYTPVGAGWSYFNREANLPECPDPSNPNYSYGDCTNLNDGPWEVCFIAEPICLEPGIELCEISFKTFSSGETGCDPLLTCPDDLPTVKQFTKRCCEPPIILNEEVDFEVCSGDLFELDLISNMDPETTYEWYVAPNPYGANSGSGSTISDVLTNTTGSPVTVVYYVTPTCLLGCIGEQLIVTVTILPEPLVEIFPPYPVICDGECIELTAEFPNGNSLPCIWSDGTSGSTSIIVCQAGYYSVTVTDSNGCTSEAGTYVDEYYVPFVTIEASPGTEACENGPNYPITLTANTFGGSGFYYYVWSSGGNEQSELAYESGIYTVIVYDGGFGCYEVVDNISITIFPEPIIEISGPTTICNNEPPICFEASPPGGTWEGPVDINGCVDPQNLGAGFYTIIYEYVDENGCENSSNFEFEIKGVPIQPDQIPDLFICKNGSTDNYVIPEVPFAQEYEWTILGSGTIISGQGTNNIEVSWQAPGGQICVVANGECGPSIPTCFNVEVQEIPLADFDSPDFICEDEIAFLNYNGNIGLNTVLIWDFGGGSVVNGDPNSGTFGLQFTEGQHIITLQTEENGCLSEPISRIIQVDPAFPAPQINCIPTVDAIEFFWDPIPNVTSYLVNGQFQTETTFTANNIPPNESVSITVEAISTNYCPNSFSEINCTTLDCPDISINIQSVQNFCSNNLPLAEIELEVEVLGTDGNGTLTWSGPGIVDYINCIFDPSSDEVTIGTNEIIFTYQEGYCTYSEILTINISEPPQAEAGESLVLTCAESEQIIIGSGNGNPFWEGPGILSGENTFSPTITAPGIYTLTTTDLVTGCSSTDLVEIFENFNTPIAVVGEDQILTCEITECVLTSIGNTQNNLIPQWEGPGINFSNFNSPTPLVDIPGTYTLTILNTDNGCISEPETVVVSQNIEQPIVEVIIVGEFDCLSNSVVLKPAFQDDVAYEWTTPNGLIINELSIEIFEEGIYHLSVTDTINGCSSSENIIVENFSNYPIANAGDDKTITCNYPEVVLNGVDSETGPNIQYFWSGPTGGIIGSNNQIQAIASLEGIYTLKVTNISNGCFSEDTVYVTSNTLAPSVDAGAEQIFGCDVQSIFLSGTVSQSADQYIWQNEDYAVISSDLEVEIMTPGWYYLSASNSENGCIEVDSIYISNNENIPYEINAISKGATCYGEKNGLIEIESVIGGTPPYLFSIDNQAFSANYIWPNLESGFYDLTVQDALGCTYQQIVEVPESMPTAIDLGSDIILELGQTENILLTTNLNENSIESILWSPSEIVTCLDESCLNISVTTVNTTSLHVILTDTAGCTDEDEIVLRVQKNRDLFIPNVFSPNGDGVNDFFNVFSGQGVREVRNLRIFDRWGELIFQLPKVQDGSNNPLVGWDGTLNGNTLNPGVFIYVVDVEFVDGLVKVFKGDITLVK